jgi:hypothetical protein
MAPRCSGRACTAGQLAQPQRARARGSGMWAAAAGRERTAAPRLPHRPPPPAGERRQPQEHPARGLPRGAGSRAPRSASAGSTVEQRCRCTPLRLCPPLPASPPPPPAVPQNLIRGRGLFCRSLMKSQAASPSFTPVYAALIGVVNTKFPELGELLLQRLILQVHEALAGTDGRRLGFGGRSAARAGRAAASPGRTGGAGRRRTVGWPACAFWASAAAGGGAVRQAASLCEPACVSQPRPAPPRPARPGPPPHAVQALLQAQRQARVHRGVQVPRAPGQPGGEEGGRGRRWEAARRREGEEEGGSPKEGGGGGGRQPEGGRGRRREAAREPRLPAAWPLRRCGQPARLHDFAQLRPGACGPVRQHTRVCCTRVTAEAVRPPPSPLTPRATSPAPCSPSQGVAHEVLALETLILLLEQVGSQRPAASGREGGPRPGGERSVWDGEGHRGGCMGVARRCVPVPVPVPPPAHASRVRPPARPVPPRGRSPARTAWRWR